MLLLIYRLDITKCHTFSKLKKTYVEKHGLTFSGNFCTLKVFIFRTFKGFFSYNLDITKLFCKIPNQKYAWKYHYLGLGDKILIYEESITLL